MNLISSRQNPLVRAYRDLAAHAASDGAQLLLDGLHLVREAVAAGVPLASVAIAASRLATDSDERTLATALEHDGVEVFAVDDHAFHAMSPVRTPSGIVAIARHRPTTEAELVAHPQLFVIVVSGVQDPGNLGALIRVAEAAGASGVAVCEASANPFSWKAVRGSMGSVLRLPVWRGGSTEHIVAALRRAGARTIAAVPTQGVDPDAIDWSGRVALVLGGEGGGLDPHVVEACDLRVTIPMAPPVESLNVAAAGAVLAYAARRARA